MAVQGRCGKPHSTDRPNVDAADGAERYMWAYVKGDGVVLSIPGIRDLELSADDAQVIGEMLITQSEEAKARSSRGQQGHEQDS
jgi:hypothetical protein